MSSNRVLAGHSIGALLPKLDDPDPDIRFMQLNDLSAILQQQASDYLKTDSNASLRITDKVVKTLTDTNGEVQSQALKCIGPLSTRIADAHIASLLEKILDLANSASDPSVSITALRLIVISLPRSTSSLTTKEIDAAWSAIRAVLIPRLVGYRPGGKDSKAKSTPPGLLQQQQQQQQKSNSYSADAVEVAIEVTRCYGSLMSDDELGALASAALEIIESAQANGVVKKRILVLLSTIAFILKTQHLTNLINHLVQLLSDTGLPTTHRRYLVACVGSIVRMIPAKFTAYLQTTVPLVLQVLSQDELDASKVDSDADDTAEPDPEVDELREAALTTIDSMITLCSVDMHFATVNCLNAAVRFLKYDPNVIEDDEAMSDPLNTSADEDAMSDGEDDDDFAELDDDDGAFSDVEDMSWKVRRCAAKLLHSIIAQTPSSRLDSIFSTASTVLLLRLSAEREDSVRLEIMSALTAVILKTSVSSSLRTSPVEAGGPAVISHKRKREDSFVNSDAELAGLVHSRSSPPYVPAVPPTGLGAHVIALVPKIVQITVRLWKKANIPIKQSAVVMLRSFTASRNGALADQLSLVQPLLTEALAAHHGTSSTGVSGSTATAASLQLETLALISVLAETNASTTLDPFITALLPVVIKAANDRNYKVASAVFETIEQFAKAMCPPRATPNSGYAKQIQDLFQTCQISVTDTSGDLEVRHKAIQVFGLIIARTSGTQLLPLQLRIEGLGLLSDRLKNETTRLETARAISSIAESVTPTDATGPEWVQEVSLELAAQLRKSDRALRLASLEALQYLALNPVCASQYGTDTIANVHGNLLPLLRAEDFAFLTPALVILAKTIPTSAATLVNPPTIEALCRLAVARFDGAPLKAYLLVIKVIGESGLGPAVMSGLLAVGASGDPHVLGRAIGTLVVYGGNNLGVTTDSFVREAANKNEDSACLALSVLGEISLRSGSTSPLPIDIFTKSLSAKSERVRLAGAVAFGSVISGNLDQHMPTVLQGLGNRDKQALFMHTLKQVLLHSEGSASLTAYSQTLWKLLLNAIDSEDDRAIGAECLGRIVLNEPDVYLSAALDVLKGHDEVKRTTLISALRYTLSFSDPEYNEALGQALVPILEAMVAGTSVDNRRLAMTAFSAAIQHKPAQVLPGIDRLLPDVLKCTHIDSSLIKTVKIGPFTHQEDSGVDLRKAAYAAVYTLVETPAAVPQLNVASVLDRIFDGILDDHDIRALSCLMLSRAAVIDPDETKKVLPRLSENFKRVLDTKAKDNAVKQEIEKIQEANATVVRVSLELNRRFPQAASGGDTDMASWKSYLDYMNKEHQSLVKSMTNDSA